MTAPFEKIQSLQNNTPKLHHSMKIYISGQITGLKPETALKHFMEAENFLKSKGHNVFNPMLTNGNKKLNWKQLMLLSIEELFECEAIYMLHNWRKSKGARIEHAVADEMEMPVYYAGSIVEP